MACGPVNTVILGAVLAGGASRRFGSDKAMAMAAGKALIDHVLARLGPQCAAMVVVGRNHGPLPSIADRPTGGHGPLAALNAALAYGAEAGFSDVLAVPCDVPDLPADLLCQLGQGPAVLAECPVIGLWPVGYGELLEPWIAAGNRSVTGFAERAGARLIAASVPITNINHPAHLSAWLHSGPGAEPPCESSGSSLSTQPG